MDQDPKIENQIGAWPAASRAVFVGRLDFFTPRMPIHQAKASLIMKKADQNILLNGCNRLYSFAE
jgi:hypothetical protein